MPNHVGMPASMHLDQFGKIVKWAFGDIPYLVGSATYNKTGWRDVDIRLILMDEEFEALDIGAPGDDASNAKWMALCMAFSALAKQMTGLPVDFQIQQCTWANRKYPREGREGERIPIGMFPVNSR